MNLFPLDDQTGKTSGIASVLISDIRDLINAAKLGLAATVNSTMTLLYWRIGRRIQSEVLQGGAG